MPDASPTTDRATGEARPAVVGGGVVTNGNTAAISNGATSPTPTPAPTHISLNTLNSLPALPNTLPLTLPPAPAVAPFPSPVTAIPPFLAKIRTHHLASRAAAADYRPGSSASSPLLIGSPAATPTAPPPAAPPNALYLPPPAVPIMEEDLVPPENFAPVCAGVYRCGFPKKRNFKFLETLQLKTVLTLVLEDYPDANLKWCQSQDIQFMQFGIPGNKEPFDNIPEDVICSALVAILDRRNHPVLIHCNKGKHRTGCLIGCIRKLQSWSLTSIFDEYRRFSFPKSRAVDQQFIDLFAVPPVWAEVTGPTGGGLLNLPAWRMLAIPLRLAALMEIEREKGRERDQRRLAGAAGAGGTGVTAVGVLGPGGLAAGSSGAGSLATSPAAVSVATLSPSTTRIERDGPSPVLDARVGIVV